MAGYWERRTTRAASLSRATAGFSVVLLVIAALSHRFGLLETPAFLAVLAVVAAVALLALAFAARAFFRIWTFGDLGGRDLAAGVLAALVVLAPFGYGASLVVGRPWLTDISTDPSDPPALSAFRPADANPLALPDPEKARLQAAEYPEVTGHRYDQPFETVQQAAASMIAQRGWVVDATLVDPAGEITWQMSGRSLVLGMPFDAAVRLTDEGETAYVDMRSASRYAPHDLGANAERIAAFLRDLDAALAAP